MLFGGYPRLEKCFEVVGWLSLSSQGFQCIFHAADALLKISVKCVAVGLLFESSIAVAGLLHVHAGGGILCVPGYTDLAGRSFWGIYRIHFCGRKN